MVQQGLADRERGRSGVVHAWIPSRTLPRGLPGNANGVVELRPEARQLLRAKSHP